MKKMVLFIITASVISVITAVILLLFGPEPAAAGVWQYRYFPGDKSARESEIWKSTWESQEKWARFPEEKSGSFTEETAELSVPDRPGNVSAAVTAENSDTSAFWQLQYFPWKDFYVYSHDKAINGVALGYYLPQKEINGVSLAMFHLFNSSKNGFSMSLVDLSGASSGFSMFVAGGAVVNNGCSIGLWNLTENNRGVQIGIINREENNLLLEYPMKPEKQSDRFGVQAGLINYSDAPGVQFGLWNTNPNSLIKHFPLFNICF